MVTADRSQQCRNIDIRAYDRIEYPFKAQIRDAFETFFERIETGDADAVGWGETFARKEAEEGRFAGAVG